MSIITVIFLENDLMPAELKYFDGGIGAIIIGKGHLTGKELIETIKEVLRSEENTRKYKYSLLDLTLIEGSDVSNADIMAIVDLQAKASKINPDRVFAVAANEDLAFGLSRVWEAQSYGVEGERTVARSREEAESWLREKVKSNFNIDITFG